MAEELVPAEVTGTMVSSSALVVVHTGDVVIEVEAARVDARWVATLLRELAYSTECDRSIHRLVISRSPS